MNCKKVWTRAHQNEILLPSFVNDQLRAHQEQVFYEREMALFPTTIEVIENRREEERMRFEYRILEEEKNMMYVNNRYLKTVIREHENLIRMKERIPKMYSDINMQEIEQKIIEWKKEYDAKQAEYFQVHTRSKFLMHLVEMNTEDRKAVMANNIEGVDPYNILETLILTGQLGEATRRTRTQFIRACPIETCRGFLSQQWKCGLCNVFTCSKCNIPKIPKQTNSGEEEQEHVCNPDDVATAELLAKDTKPCPKCGTGIFKIDGCDQMWCTECRTAFNWRTGQLETGHVHNPHYFEYQRRIGADARNILDMPCNALAPDQYHGIIHHLISIATNSNSCSAEERKKRELTPIQVTKEMRTKIRERANDYAVSINEYAGRILPRYRPDAIQNNLELRVQYLTEQITKEEFKSTLSREAKQFHRKIEIGQVVQTVIFGMSDILTRLAEYLRENYDRELNVNYVDFGKIEAMYSEIDALIDYANECLDFICKQYKLTRVAMFVRDGSKGNPPGLYTARAKESETEGSVLYPVKPV
jgi:hypothetical protein